VGFVVIQSLARTGQDLLTFIENSIQHCVAGFVLLTPDDEGRLYQFGEPMRQRARQNVVFESGYLTALFRGANRVYFLMQGDLEIPSDLNGLLRQPASKKRQGTKSREVGHGLGSRRYGDCMSGGTVKPDFWASFHFHHSSFFCST
jgi:predicted nucleotide-binding protein